MGISTKLRAYVERQIATIVPGFDHEIRVPGWAAETALERSDRNATAQIGRSGFDPMISGHYATFLYYLSHTLREDRVTATHVFLLNKALNGIDLFYEVEMPDHFLIGHTVGMVFAKATYGDRCVFHQGCTVGRILNDRPTLESGVVLYPNASIIGRCHVRENTVVSAGVQLINRDTPGQCIVFQGEGGRPTFKPIMEQFHLRYFKA